MSRTKMTGRKGLGRTAMGGVGENVEAVADNLVQTWKPTGFYTVAQVNAILAAMKQVQDRVNAVIDQGVGTSTGADAGRFLGVSLLSDDDKSLLRSVQTRVMYTYADMVRPMATALRLAAEQNAAAVDAPQFRALVIAYLYKAAWGIQTVQNMRSSLSWAQRAAEWIGDATVKAGDVARAVTGVTLDVLKAAGAAIVAVPDTIATLYTVAKWGGLAYGLWWIWEQTGRGRVL